MYRFVAFCWDKEDPKKTARAQRLGRRLLASAPGMACVLELPGLCVFHALHKHGARRAYVLNNDGGVILGRLFRRQPSGEYDPADPDFDPNFDNTESELLIRSGGRRLVERYWGHYVAFLRSSDGRAQYILRDPTGGLPCFRLGAGGIEILASDIEDYVHLDLTPFSVNWEHIAAFFVHVRLVTETTGFNEVKQVGAGTCITLENGASTQSYYWDPAAIYRAGTIEEDPEQARSALRRDIRACTSAWASCYRNIVLELSGGIDSSVVAACLAAAKPSREVLCVNFASDGAEGDERAFAQATAQHTGLRLVEAQLRASDESFESRLDRSKLPSPAVLGLLGKATSLRAKIVKEERAGAVFSGRGGDHLLQHEQSDRIAAEYAHRHGLQPKLLEIVAATSRMTGQSFWAVLAAAIRTGLFRRAYDPYAVLEVPSILTGDVRASLKSDSYRHPWIDRATGLPANKIQQIFHIVDCQPFFQLPYPYAELVHPMISQPIVERCLQIPGYVLAHRGTDRGLLREAFEKDLPGEVTNRLSKGGTTTYFIRMLVENLSFLKAFLLDGALVSEGIVSRADLERQLNERQLLRGNEVASILKAARAEAWLRNWADTSHRAAA